MVTELISGRDGELKVACLEDFINSVKLRERGISYSVVSIIGPHNSGKSSLLNQLFGTRFEQRDNTTEWEVPVTRGVWIAKAAAEEPFTLVMDLEGADSQLKGQDDTAFEKQSALFALAVADILLINTWARDCGREHGAIRPLLRTIFQEAVTMPEFHPRKTTLFLVARDMSPHDPPLKQSAVKNIHKIWEEARKFTRHENTPLTNFFNVEFFALTDSRERKEEFDVEVEKVRQKYLESVSGEAGRVGVVPALGFCLSIKDKWATIKKNKSLDLPAHMIMVATTLCDQIAEEKLGLFQSNQVWRGLQEAAKTSFDAGFGARISPILNDSLSAYNSDSEAFHFNQDVRNSKHEYLKSRILMLVHPAYIKNLGHLRSEQFQSFKTQLQAHDSKRFAESARRCKESCVAEFDRRCYEAGVKEARWDDDDSTERKQLVRDIENHTLVAAAEELPKVVNKCRDGLSRKLNGRLRTLLLSSEEISWIRRGVSEENDAAASELRSAVESFELEHTKVEEKVNEIRQYGRQLVENYLRDLKNEGGVVVLMKERYICSLFAQTQMQATAIEDSINNSSAHQTACRESLKILSVMAAIRLEEGEGDDDYIERVLVSALMPADADGGVQPPQDPLDAGEWPHQVITLITPTECRRIWREFTDEMRPDLLHTAHTVQQDMSSAGKSWVPPTWVIAGMIALGIAGFVLFLRFTNLDVLLVVLKAAWEGIKIVGIEACIYNNVREFCRKNDITFDRFRRKFSDLMENLLKALKKFYNNLKNRFATSTSQYAAIQWVAA